MNVFGFFSVLILVFPLPLMSNWYFDRVDLGHINKFYQYLVADV